MTENYESGYDQIQFNSKKYATISFLSDLGTEDESVAACKAVMRQQCPDVTIVDITHEVPAFDIRYGALVLTRAIQFLNQGVVVAYVDPGSPKDQRYIAVELEGGVLIGPDNGILAPAVRVIGQPKRVHAITDESYRYDTPSHIFAARDILAPAAGLIANGLDIAELGPQVPLSDLVPVLLEAASFDKGGAINAEVWSVDRFGNIEINITPEDLEVVNAKIGDNIILRINDQDYVAKYVETFADLGVSELGILTDSSGLLSIFKNLDDAAKSLNIKAGKSLVLLAPNTEVTGELDENVQYPQEIQLPQEDLPQTSFNEPTPNVQDVMQASGNPSAYNEFVDPNLNPAPVEDQLPDYLQPQNETQPQARVQPQAPQQWQEPAQPQPYSQQPPVQPYQEQPQPQQWQEPTQVPQPPQQQPAQQPQQQPPVQPQPSDTYQQQPHQSEQWQEPAQPQPYSQQPPVQPYQEQPQAPAQEDPYSGVIPSSSPQDNWQIPQEQNENGDQDTPPLPENVFDLFKEDEENN